MNFSDLHNEVKKVNNSLSSHGCSNHLVFKAFPKGKCQLPYVVYFTGNYDEYGNRSGIGNDKFILSAGVNFDDLCEEFDSDVYSGNVDCVANFLESNPKDYKRDTFSYCNFMRIFGNNNK